MKVAVVSCSAKRELSLTLQAAMLLGKLFPNDEFQTVFPDAQTGLIDEDEMVYLKDSNLILLLSSPYHFQIPSQTMTTLNQIGQKLWAYKPITLLTTSNFSMDICVHDYVERWAQRNHFDFIRSLSLFSEDILSDRGKEELFCWFKYVTREVMEGPKIDFAISGKYTAVIMDLSSDEDDDVTNCIVEYKDELERHGCKVRIVRLRDYPIKPCVGCGVCDTTRICAIKDNMDVLLDAIYMGTDIIIPVGRLINGFYTDMFKRFQDRHIQFGRCPLDDEVIWVYSYLQGLNYRNSDEAALKTWALAYLSFTGSVYCGVWHGFSAKAVRQALFAAEEKLLPQRNTYSELLGARFADLARELQYRSPQDFAYFSKRNAYAQRPVNTKVTAVATAEDVRKSTEMRLIPFNMQRLTLKYGSIKVHERRANKNKPYRERFTGSAVMSAKSGISNLFRKKKV